MQLRGLKLENIRSYGEGETSVELRPGLTLFEGDIGSGKSTILSAIEFGLFGLGDVEAKHLLRHGSKKAKVEVKFEVKGKEYTVSRSLSKSGRGIQQEECRLEGDGVAETYSPSELKPRVLEILGFNEKPDTKSTSRIFRYAVYTPQESMKEVLSMGEGQRLDTLRRAFGIERYSWAVSNAEDAVVREWLNGRLNALQETVDTLPRRTSELEAERRDLEELEADGVALEQAEKEAAAAHRTLQGKVEELRPRRLAFARLRSEIPLLESDTKETKKRRAQLAEDQSAVEAELREASEAASSLEAIRPDYESYVSLKEKATELEAAVDEEARLSKDEQKLRGRIEIEKRVIENEVATLRLQVTSGQGIQAKLASLEERVRALTARRADLESRAKSLEEVEAGMKALAKEEVELEAERRSGEREMRKAEEEWGSIDSIKVGAPCPLCKATLTPEHYEQVREEYSSRLSTLKGNLDPIIAKLEAVRADLKEQEEKASELRPSRAESNRAGADLAQAQEELKQLRIRSAELEEAAASLASKKATLEEEGFAQTERVALRELQSRLDALGPKVAQFEAARKQVAEMETRRMPQRFVQLEVMALKERGLGIAPGQARGARAGAGFEIGPKGEGPEGEIGRVGR